MALIGIIIGGLIVQWFTITYATNSGTISATYPTPFTSTNIALAWSFKDNNRSNCPDFENVTKTGFDFRSYQFTSTGVAYVTAIGY